MMIPVIIPFYKNHEQLEKCKAHLQAQTVPVEIFVRDNSVDNIQFTAAVNEGFRKYMSEPCTYMITVNQDMYLEPDAVERMVEFMDAKPECGIGAPLQISHLDPNEVIDAGGAQTTPLGRCFVGALSKFKKDRALFWASAACWIVRKAMMVEIGLLDENLIFVGSDSDYCFTARARGWEVWRVTGAKGVHERGSAFNDTSPQLRQLKKDDTVYFKAKWVHGALFKVLEFDGKASPGTITRGRKNLQEQENVVV